MIPPTRPGVTLLRAALERRVARHADKIATASRVGRAVLRARVDPVDALAGLVGEILESHAANEENGEEDE